MIPPQAPFFPANRLNTLTFPAMFHVAVEAPRAAAALVMAGFISWACVVEAQRMRVRLERLREEFVALVAHDLRSPVTTIGLSATALLRSWAAKGGGEEERRLIAAVAASANNLGRRVGDLLASSLVESRQLSLVRERIDLARFLPELVDRAAPLTRGHDVRVELPQAPVLVEVDPQRIEQALGNLLSNAGKHADPGTEIELRVVVHPAEVELRVTNRGRCIPPEERARLFERFYRRPGTKGIGLGLYIVKGLVEAHGGRVWAESAGGSTTFALTLPR